MAIVPRKQRVKTVDEITVSDLERDPVWEYRDDIESEDRAVRPVKAVPVASCAGRIFGLQIGLANGTETWATLDCVDASNEEANKHFLVLSVERDGRWFTMDRYHDVTYPKNGPKALARFLGLPAKSVFPIRFDLSTLVQGNSSALKGVIGQKPERILNDSELVSLALPR